MTATPKSRAKKGVDPKDIREAAFRLLCEEGEDGFGVRRLAASLALDPMTVLHHGRSREKLLRDAAERMLTELPLVEPSLPWRDRLIGVAHGFRGLARRYPKAFPALLRFPTTGPVDHRYGELVYAAMMETAGEPKRAVMLALGFYALVIGFAVTEIGGMLDTHDEVSDREITSSPQAYPVTNALLPAFAALDHDATFEATIQTFLDGIVG